MFTIHLKNLQFFSFQGIHPEERILGNDYELNLSVSFPSDKKIATLDQTLDYGELFAMIEKRMSIPTALMETIVQDLAQEIHDRFPQVSAITISIDKKNPPIPNIRGAAGVSFTQSY